MVTNTTTYPFYYKVKTAAFAFDSKYTKRDSKAEFVFGDVILNSSLIIHGHTPIIHRRRLYGRGPCDIGLGLYDLGEHVHLPIWGEGRWTYLRQVPLNYMQHSHMAVMYWKNKVNCFQNICICE